MGLILNFVVQELRSLGRAPKSTSYNEAHPDDSEMQFGGYCYNHPNANTDADATSRPPKRRGLRRLRKDGRRGSVSSGGSSAQRNSDDGAVHAAPACHPRALGTSLASSSSTRSHAPSSYDSQQFYTNSPQPRGYSVTGGPIYDHVDEYQSGEVHRSHGDPGSAGPPFGGELQQRSRDRCADNLSDTEARTPSP